MSEIVNCELKVESKYVHNPGYERTGSIIIRLLRKTQIEETSNIQDIYTTPLSEKISRSLFRLCSEDFTDYYVQSLLEALEVPSEFINWLKPQIVSAVVNRAIETRNDGYRDFEVIVDIELTTIDFVLTESELYERVVMESEDECEEEEEDLDERVMMELEDECESESGIDIFD